MAAPRLVVVRPEPGNARTAAAARALGFAVDTMPLFAVVPLGWEAPDPNRYDAILVTSANAMRHGGTGLAPLTALPVLAVGEASAGAAREAGFVVALIGTADAAALVTQADDRYPRLLHLGGRERVDVPGATAIAVYASEAMPAPADAAARLRGATVLLHSARAARRVAELADDRSLTAVATISPAVLAAAGTGWRGAVAATVPTDAALLAGASGLAH